MYFVFSILIWSTFNLALVSAQGEIRNIPELAIPQMPKGPNCGDSFPGTPQWNKCWENFRTDMAMFQYRMQEYGIQLSKIIEKSATKGKMQSNVVSSKMGGTSNVLTSGYAIQAKGLSISTTTQNGKLQVKLPIAGMDNIESRINGQEVELRVGTNENAKWVKIRFPNTVKPSDMKLERMEDGIILSGPVQNTGNLATSQISNYMVSYPFHYYGFGMPAIMGSPGQEKSQPPKQNSQMWFF